LQWMAARSPGGAAHRRAVNNFQCTLIIASLDGKDRGIGVRKIRKRQMALPLTPESPRWGEFVHTLVATLGTPPSGCKGDYRHAREILTEMGGIDIEASLRCFKSDGGYCDCEILLNADPTMCIWADDRH